MIKKRVLTTRKRNTKSKLTASFYDNRIKSTLKDNNEISDNSIVKTYHLFSASVLESIEYFN